VGSLVLGVNENVAKSSFASLAFARI
jgi:hypothetical protein